MQRAGYQLQWQRSDRMKGGVMVTQFEIYEGMLNHAVESLLGKIRTNLDISMQVLEAVRNEQSVQLRNTMQENQNKSMSSLSATGQPKMIWTELIQQSGEKISERFWNFSFTLIS
ncbi:MAG: hypothetical protein EVA80_00590 [Proteobacteria bacterium]|nr:MAG: hypothetical protein EVA80_00590 [Pseudomonadota bacterium]